MSNETVQVLTITTSYKARKVSAKELVQLGHDQFIERLDDTPLDVYKNIDWLNSLSAKKKLYHLEFIDENAVLTEHLLADLEPRQ